MTWNGKHPFAELVTTIYPTRVTLTHEAMEAVETQIKWLLALEKRFVDIAPSSRAIRDT
jgi:hypothetical protein